jgi:prophage regulatory protein
MIKKNSPNKPIPPSEDDISAPAAGAEEIAATGNRGAPGEPQTARPMLSEKQVLALIPIARSTLWRLEATGRFPKGSYIPGTNRKLYFEDEVIAWQNRVDGHVGPRRRPRRKTPKPAKQTA